MSRTKRRKPFLIKLREPVLVSRGMAVSMRFGYAMCVLVAALTAPAWYGHVIFGLACALVLWDTARDCFRTSPAAGTTTHDFQEIVDKLEAARRHLDEVNRRDRSSLKDEDTI